MTAPFRPGDRVRFISGPVMTVEEPVDRDGDVLCAWWSAEDEFCRNYFRAELLVHAQEIYILEDEPRVHRLGRPRKPRRNPFRKLLSKFFD